MMFLPNYGNRVPEDGAYSGNAKISNAVNMTGLFTAPARGEGSSLGAINFSSSVYNVPQLVLDLATVKTWSVFVSVSVGPLSVSLSEEYDIPDALTLMDRLTDDKLKSFSGTVSDSGNSGSLLVNFGSFFFSPTYYAENSTWQSFGSVSVSYFDQDGEANLSGRGGFQFNPTNGTNSGITLTIGTDVVDMYFAENVASAPTGVITITPVSYYT